MGSSTDQQSKLRSAAKKATKLGLTQTDYTLIVCMDRKTAKCCSANSMQACWKTLKQRSREFRKGGRGLVIRIKSGCIGICKAGPIIGVLPDGVWYGHCTPKVIDQIFEDHLAEGRIVDSNVIAKPPDS